ncbi:hypothetical protein GOODEAATRI_027730, partial [Goodea atripinnis]
VDNVSRMLWYIQPGGENVSLDFLTKITETTDYIHHLRKAKMTSATILNYIKNMIRFIQFLKLELSLKDSASIYLPKCQAYMDLLSTLRKPVSKQHSQAVCKTRYDRYVEGQRSLHECHKVMRVCKKDMLGLFAKLLEQKQISREEKTLFLYYCEAIILLKHYQRPGVVEGFTMLDAYYHYIRPEFVKESGEEEDHFFIGSHGRPISCASQDLSRDPESCGNPGRPNVYGGAEDHRVVATKPFLKGSILCDYHGRIITAAEGQEIQDTIEDNKCYLFFVKDLCIDAKTFPCECHPDKETLGRKINHSKKNANVKPVHSKMQFPDGTKDIILFKAIKDICIDEEIKFDYGDPQTRTRARLNAAAPPLLALCPTCVPERPAGPLGTFGLFGIRSLLHLVAVFGSGPFGNTPRKLWDFAARGPNVREGRARARAEIPGACQECGRPGRPRAPAGAGKKSEVGPRSSLVG